ncbi:MAG TPA: hypothetical protein V6D15_13445 [Oculatellaceae cyanobacterium]|jgi:hypothetical protein
MNCLNWSKLFWSITFTVSLSLMTLSLSDANQVSGTPVNSDTEISSTGW